MLKTHLDARGFGSAEVVEIPGATHFVHLDRDERGRADFAAGVSAFLRGGAD